MINLYIFMLYANDRNVFEYFCDVHGAPIECGGTYWMWLYVAATQTPCFCHTLQPVQCVHPPSRHHACCCHTLQPEHPPPRHHVVVTPCSPNTSLPDTMLLSHHTVSTPSFRTIYVFVTPCSQYTLLLDNNCCHTLQLVDPPSKHYTVVIPCRPYTLLPVTMLLSRPAPVLHACPDTMLLSTLQPSRPPSRHHVVVTPCRDEQPVHRDAHHMA